MGEDELISGLKRGDATAFRYAVDRYQVAVLNCCFRFVRNRETAEDLTQDVFLEVHRSIGSFRSNAKFSTWLLRIAISKSLDHLKHMKRQKRMGFLKSLLAREELIDSAIASDTPGPDQMLENEERKRVLSWAIESLPENQKVAFTLSKYDELSYKEIAEILDTTVSAVESLIVRAKAHLKKALFGYYEKHL